MHIENSVARMPYLANNKGRIVLMKTQVKGVERVVWDFTLLVALLFRDALAKLRSAPELLEKVKRFAFWCGTP